MSRRMSFASTMACLFVLFCAIPLHAQDVRVTVEVDSLTSRIGEWIEARVLVDAPSGQRVVLPEKAEDFGGIDVVTSEAAEHMAEAGRTRIERAYTLIVFDTGAVPLSARVTWKVKGDTTTYVATSSPLTLQVAGVEIDTAASFKDITDVLDVPLSIWDYLLILAIVLAVLAAAWYGWRYYKRRRDRAEGIEPADPDVPAYDLALEQLHAIEHARMWERGEHKSFQSDVTGVLRAYIERAHEVPALEQTTHEIVGGVALAGFAPETVAKLEQLLERADMTKFARYVPSIDEHRASLVGAYDVLEHGHGLEVRRAAEARVREAAGDDGTSAAATSGASADRDAVRGEAEA